MISIAFDPQTSGGLLIAVPEHEGISLVAALHRAGIAEACIVGRVSRRSALDRNSLTEASSSGAPEE